MREKFEIFVALLILSAMSVIPFSFADESDASAFVQTFHAYCVEPLGDFSKRDAMVRAFGLRRMSDDMTIAGASGIARNPRAFEISDKGITIFLSYSDAGECGTLTRGPSAREVKRKLSEFYKYSSVQTSSEAGQAMSIYRLGSDSWYSGAVITISYLLNEPESVVALSFLPKEVANRIL